MIITWTEDVRSERDVHPLKIDETGEKQDVSPNKVCQVSGTDHPSNGERSYQRHYLES